MEYVIEAINSDDMRSWLATIRYCMRSTPTVQMPGGESPLTAMPNLTTMPASPPQAANIPSTGSTEGKETSSHFYSPERFLLSSSKYFVTYGNRCNWRKYDRHE